MLLAPFVPGFAEKVSTPHTSSVLTPLGVPPLQHWLVFLTCPVSPNGLLGSNADVPATLTARNLFGLGSYSRFCLPQLFSFPPLILSLRPTFYSSLFVTVTFAPPFDSSLGVFPTTVPPPLANG